MSSSAHVYLGPYATFAAKKQTEPVSIRACPNEACTARRPSSRWDAVSASVGFCSACGTAIGTVTLDFEHYVNPDDILGNEELTNISPMHKDESHYYGANVACGSRSFHMSLDEATVTPISFEDIRREIVLFNMKFEGHLKNLANEFGQVEVKWGHIVYWL